MLVATVKGTGAGAVAYTVATDHLTGSNVVSSGSGAVEEVMDYYPYGSVRLDEKAGSFDEKRKYAGHEYDSETGLSYMVARYYDGGLGRFYSQDQLFWGLPVEYLLDPQQQNSYSYARNNPMKYIDPTGLASAMIVYGDNYDRSDRDAWKNKAESKAQELRDQDAERIKNNQQPLYSDGVFVVDGSTFDNWQNALKNQKDIQLIEYYGHGDGNALYLRRATNVDGKSRIESIYRAGWDESVDTYTDGSRDHLVTELSLSNTSTDLKIHLYSCNARVGGDKSVAYSFANHFGAPVWAAGTFTNFRGNDEYIRTRWALLALIQSGGKDDGSFKVVRPLEITKP